jgi:hypothetical protein
MAKALQIGDRVAYTRNALLTFGSGYADLRGTIIELEEVTPGWTLATVEWENWGGTPGTLKVINVNNLCRPRSRAFIE